MFSDLIDALEKVAKAVVELKSVRAKTRQKYRDAVQETYKLLDAALVLVDLRLNSLLLIEHERGRKSEKQERFALELRRLDSLEDWERMNHEVGLSRNLRVVSKEMDHIVFGVVRPTKARDRENMRRLVDEILEREYTLAQFITSSLRKLARRASAARKSSEGYERAESAVRRTKQALQKERERLRRSEMQFLDSA
jgi:hypothetical protein